MFDDVPVRVWLLIAIAAAAYMPADYVFKYLSHAPSRRDITQPPEDLSWRTSKALARSSAILAALIAFAGFIFTPAAAQFAQSPRFWPILMVGLGGGALFTVSRGFSSGRIAPLVRGNFGTYEREGQPKRFWASMAWNAVFGCVFIWFAFQLNEQASAEVAGVQCYDEKTTYSLQQVLSACNKLIDDPNTSRDKRAEWLAIRGFAYQRSGDFRHATSDYSEAIRLDPHDFYPFYNRGLIHQQLGDSRSAIADYTMAIQLRPNSADSYFSRGLSLLDTGRLDRAVADFTRAHELNPKDPWPIANRGIAYAWKKDRALAEQDFKAVRAIDPTNPVLLRGEALLSMDARDMKTAVDRLTASMGRDPDNAWAVRMRAEAYRQLGEHEKSRADSDRLLQLRKAEDRAQIARR